MNTFAAIFLIWLVCIAVIAVLAAGAWFLMRAWEPFDEVDE